VEADKTFYLVMAGLVPAIPVGEAAPFPIEMAGARPIGAKIRR
jgi:hypothetical protein